MNILDKSNKSAAPIPKTDKTSSKRVKFNWVSAGDPGVFMMINKGDLNLEGKYQRGGVFGISKAKVLDIAREWDWKAFGVLAVIKRADGSLWVYDGGHRLRASFYRDDIEELPCMVFECNDLKEEAKAFVVTNTMVSNVSAFHLHRASVLAGEPLALAVEGVVEKYGYTPTDAKKRGGFGAIGTLRSLVTLDAAMADKVFAACVRIAVDQEPISGEVLEAIFYCQQKLGSRADILEGEHLEKLIQEGLKGIQIAIRREKHIVGKGGTSVTAKAVLDLLNKGKRRKMSFA